jgi:flagellin
MIINHNLSGNTALYYLNKNADSASDSMEKLSSGLRINKAADDAAGLSISQQMQAQINGLTQASSNSQDGVSLLQTAEGGLSTTQNILQRMNELATEAANGTNVTTDTSAIQSELTQLASQIDDIGQQTNFNGVSLLSVGVGAVTLTFQVGSTSNAYDQLGLNLGSIEVDSNSLNVDTTTISVATTTEASASISIIQAAIDTVSAARSYIGALQNRLTYTMDNVSTENQNLTTANANITDVDMASEMMNYSKENVLQQAAQSMLSQANQNPQQVLKLLQQ